MTTCELTTRAAARTTSARRARWLGELVLIAALYAAYSAARLIGHADLSTATSHARELLSLPAEDLIARSRRPMDPSRLLE